MWENSSWQMTVRLELSTQYMESRTPFLVALRPHSLIFMFGPYLLKPAWASPHRHHLVSSNQLHTTICLSFYHFILALIDIDARRTPNEEYGTRSGHEPEEELLMKLLDATEQVNNKKFAESMCTHQCLMNCIMLMGVVSFYHSYVNYIDSLLCAFQVNAEVSALRQQLRMCATIAQMFDCKICKEIPRSPVAYLNCCKQILGCKTCFQTCIQYNTSCPLCRNPELCSSDITAMDPLLEALRFYNMD